METYRQSLERIYAELAASQLVTEKNANEENINKFINLLNSANPQNEEQHTYFDCVNGLYCNNKLVFKRYLEKSNQEFLILLTDGFSIAVNFGINYILFLKFDTTTGEFVGLLPTRTHDNRGDRPQRDNYSQPRDNNRPQRDNNNTQKRDNYRPQRDNNDYPQKRDNNRPQRDTNDRPRRNNNDYPQKRDNNDYPQKRDNNCPQRDNDNRPQNRRQLNKLEYKPVHADLSKQGASKTYASALSNKIPAMSFDDKDDAPNTTCSATTTSADSMVTVDTSILEKTMNETW